MLRNVLIALVEVQLEELRQRVDPPLGEISPAGVADDILRYLDSIPVVLADFLRLELDKLDFALPPFSSRPLAERVQRIRSGRWEGVSWSILSYAFAACWLVLFSRPEVRRALNAQSLPSDPSALPNDAVELDANAPIHGSYDACVIGSGAGGSMVAHRLGAAGQRVLLVDAGAFVPPQHLSTRHDHSLGRLYKGGGIQPAVPSIGALLGNRIAGINVLQARVVGGGPYVNNAVQLPISQARFEAAWKSRGFPLAWADVEAALRLVAGELRCGAPSLDPALLPDPRASFSTGARSARVEEAARLLWARTASNPVSLWDCVGCGFCNLGCRFNRKSGGVHGARPAEAPKSYLMRALTETSGHVQLRSGMQAERFEIDGQGRVARLIVRKVDSGKPHAIEARSYVLAAGPIASSRVLQETHFRRPWNARAIGEGLAINLTTPLIAQLTDPLPLRRPSPGTQMCFHVEPETGALVEGWFDYPAGLAAATCALPREVAAAIGDFARTNVCGVVVPVDDVLKVQPPPFELVADLKPADFRRLLRAVAHAARALYHSGAEAVLPASRLNANVVGPIVIDRNAALEGRVDDIVAHLERVLETPQNLSMQTPHPQGGNPLGDAPQRGVVAPSFKVYGTSNLFVADASLFPAACGTNPQMTVLALAHLAAQSIDRALRQDTLAIAEA